MWIVATILDSTLSRLQVSGPQMLRGIRINSQGSLKHRLLDSSHSKSFRFNGYGVNFHL